MGRNNYASKPCVSCRALHLPELNQQAMVDIRSAWFEEVGGAPNGNRREPPSPPPIPQTLPHTRHEGHLSAAQNDTGSVTEGALCIIDDVLHCIELGVVWHEVLEGMFGQTGIG
jgi:hypothetical protein